MTTNQAFVEAQIRHMLARLRFEHGFTNEAQQLYAAQLLREIATLNMLEPDLANVRDWQARHEEVHRTGWERAGALYLTALGAATLAERTFQRNLLERFSGIGAAGPSNDDVRQLIERTTFAGGRTARRWIGEIRDETGSRLVNQVIAARASGLSRSEMRRVLRGGREDGDMPAFREPAAWWGHMARSTFNGSGEAVQRDITQRNAEIIDAVVWVAVLDTGTTVHICLPRHGLRYTYPARTPIGHDLPYLRGPGLAHYGCRSKEQPLIVGLGDVDLRDPVAFVRSLDQTELAELLGSQGAATLFRSNRVRLADLVRNDGRRATLEDLRRQDRRILGVA